MILSLLALIVGSLQATPSLESHAQALSDDGKLFAYAVTDGTVRAMTLPEGKPRVLTSGLTQTVVDLAWSPNGQRIACVARDGSAQIHDHDHSKLLKEIPAAASVLPVWSRPTIDFVDDGTKILVTGAQARARLIDASSGALISEFLAGPESKLSSESTLEAVAISRDRKHLAVGDATGAVSVRSTHTGDIEAGPFRVPAVHSLAFDPSARQLAVGSSDNGVWIFSLDRPPEPPRLLREDDFPFPLSGISVGSVCFNADGTRLLTTTFEFGEVQLWNTSQGSIVWSTDTIDIRDSAAATTRFVGEPTVVVLAQSGVVFDGASGSRTRTLARSNGLEQFRVAGPYAWTSTAGTISIVEPRTGKLVCEIPLVALAKPPALESTVQALSHDEKIFAYSVDDGTLHIARLPEGKPIVVASGFAKKLGGLAFSPDSQELASVAPDGRIRILACKDGKLLAEFKGPPAAWPFWWTSRAITFVDVGTKLLVGGDSEEVDLIRRSDGEALSKIRLSGRRVTASAVSADSEHFAIGDELGRCGVYSANSGELEFGPIETPGHVNALSLDTHGQRLAIGSRDDRARLYTIANGATPVLLSHASENLTGELEIGYVAFSPDSKQVLSTCMLAWDMRVWDAETGVMLWSTTQGFEGVEYPVVAHFAALPEPRVITCNGFIFDARSGRALPSIGDDRYWDYECLGGPYAWRDGPLGIEIIDVRTLKRLCTLPLSAK